MIFSHVAPDRCCEGHPDPCTATDTAKNISSFTFIYTVVFLFYFIYPLVIQGKPMETTVLFTSETRLEKK